MILMLIFVVLVLLDWLAAAILVRAAARQPWIGRLSERAAAAVVLAAVASAGTVLVASRAQLVHIPQDLGLGLGIVVTLLASVPAIIWLGLYVTDRLG